jgi:ribosomal protein S27AE
MSRLRRETLLLFSGGTLGVTLNAVCPRCDVIIRMEITEGALSVVGGIKARVHCGFCHEIWDQEWKHWEVRNEYLPGTVRKASNE